MYNINCTNASTEELQPLVYNCTFVFGKSCKTKTRVENTFEKNTKINTATLGKLRIKSLVPQELRKDFKLSTASELKTNKPKKKTESFYELQGQIYLWIILVMNCYFVFQT